ncbi:hypothetical protein M595_2149 [Lyngbya aestuarii BL J]|uniref:Uncharacterized protein n=1 Tax=Lyngbya aestuarii BL J TaxID=1348334 RepID=U7QLD6_9CYAN|nr:hypothetical protein M595_2149 [Lyngbya aestuarii BL J]
MMDSKHSKWVVFSEKMLNDEAQPQDYSERFERFYDQP